MTYKNKMADINPTILMIASKLNNPLERQKLSNQIKKQDPII